MDEGASFGKALEIFARFNPALEQEVIKAKSARYCVVRSQSGACNLCATLATGEEFFFHSQEDPVLEAELWFHSLEDKETLDQIVVAGMGLGYYYFAAKQWLKEKPERLLIFLEHDLSSLYQFFTFEGCLEVLEDPQVALFAFLPDRLGEKGASLGALGNVSLLLLERSTLFTALASYHIRFADLFKKVTNILRLHASEQAFAHQFFEPETLEQNFRNFFQGLWHLPGAKLLYGMEGLFHGIPAIIAGAGPSLQEGKDVLQQIGEGAMVFGAGTGMNILNSYGVIPPLAVMVDPNDTTYSRLMANMSYEVPAAFKLGLNIQALDSIHGRKCYFKGMDPYGIHAFFDPMLKLEAFPQLYSPLSSTQSCLGVAAFLGCDPLYLTGVDLAYTGRRRYPEGFEEHPLIDTSEHLEAAHISPQRLIQAAALDGGRIETRVDWLREASLIENFPKKHPKSRLLNATAKGLLIPGVDFCSLADVNSHLAASSFDLENLVHAALENSPAISCTAKEIKEALATLCQLVDRSLEILSFLVAELAMRMASCREGGEEKREEESSTFAELTREFYESEIYAHFMKQQASDFHAMFFFKRFRFLYRQETLEPHELAQAKMNYESGVYLFHMQLLHVMRQEILNSLDLYDKQEIPPSSIPLRPESRQMPEEEWEGEAMELYPSGKPFWRRFYTKGQLHGPSLLYAEKGGLLAKGQFFMGKREGENWQFYASGNLFSLQCYKNGKKQGTQKYYYESGESKSILRYHEGLLEGRQELYHPNGTLKREIHLRKGMLHGMERVWDDRGTLLMEVEYEENMAVNVARVWHPNGKLKEEKRFFGRSRRYDHFRFNEKGELIKKQLYFPEELDKEYAEANKQTAARLKQIKERLARGRPDA